MQQESSLIVTDQDSGQERNKDEKKATDGSKTRKCVSVYPKQLRLILESIQPRN